MIKCDVSWRYFMIGVGRSGRGQPWMIYPIPFIRLRIYSNKKKKKV